MKLYNLYSLQAILGDSCNMYDAQYRLKTLECLIQTTIWRSSTIHCSELKNMQKLNTNSQVKSSGSPLQGHWSETHRSCCLTRPPLLWTQRARGVFWARWTALKREGPASPSPTGWARSRTAVQYLWSRMARLGKLISESQSFNALVRWSKLALTQTCSKWEELTTRSARQPYHPIPTFFIWPPHHHPCTFHNNEIMMKSIIIIWL